MNLLYKKKKKKEKTFTYLDHDTQTQLHLNITLPSLIHYIYTKNTKTILYNRMYRIHLCENMKVEAVHLVYNSFGCEGINSENTSSNNCCDHYIN